ncbi:putative plus-end-directed kinesin ATPase [Helianthus annuus]|nr:putative plus-end-directed kinesin ATPase [Helianthus annuus]
MLRREDGSGSGDWIYDGASDQDQQLHVFTNLNVMLTNCSKNVLTQDLQLKIIIRVTCPFGFSEFDLSDIVNDSFVRELANYDLFAWNCTDDNTLTSTNLNHDRHTSIYTFDRVFDPSCPNRSVYEQGAKDVALSTIKGINSTIFAYSQTSSGKTYTMKGIADNCINDIYAHITNATASRFVLKFSAIEIYNETVVDLLNRDSGALRLLDDPEKGTVVEKLTEEVVRNSQHLRSLIATCEDQRQVGETSLNDRSSRSHQIIRLSLVDLAGSERASQTYAAGA